MSRVMKKFFEKLYPPVLIVAYVSGVISASGYITNPMHSIAFVGAFIIAPMIGYMLWETWQQAKREVEWENRDLMREIEGNNV